MNRALPLILAAGLLAQPLWAQASQPAKPAAQAPRDGAADPADPAAPAPSEAPAVKSPAQKLYTPVPIADPTWPITKFEKVGSGPISVVLLPGLAFEGAVFDALMARNKDRYTMYALTLPGVGGTPVPEIPAGTPPSDDVLLRNAHNAILTFIAQQKLERPVLVGHSLGGMIAARLAGEQGEAFSHVVVLDSIPAVLIANGRVTRSERAELIDKTMAPSLQTLTQDQWTQQMRELLQLQVVQQSRVEALLGLVQRTPAPVGVRYFLEMLASDFTEPARAPKTPMLVLAAVNDSAPVPRTRAIYKDAYRPSESTQLAYIFGARHFLNEDAPVQVDEAIRAFIAGERVRDMNAGATLEFRESPAPPEPEPAPPKKTASDDDETVAPAAPGTKKKP